MYVPSGSCVILTLRAQSPPTGLFNAHSPQGAQLTVLACGHTRAYIARTCGVLAHLAIERVDAIAQLVCHRACSPNAPSIRHRSRRRHGVENDSIADDIHFRWRWRWRPHQCKLAEMRATARHCSAARDRGSIGRRVQRGATLCCPDGARRVPRAAL